MARVILSFSSSNIVKPLNACHVPLAYPVIVLFDNDDGGGELFGFAKANGVSNIAFSSTDLFYYLGLNLYLVKTPEKAAAP